MPAGGYSLLCFFTLRSSSCDLRGWLTAKEPHQSFEILYRSRHVELFAHEPHPAQSQTTQSDLVLEFREQRFHFLSLPLRLRELRRVGQLPCPLSCRFMDVDGEIFISPTRALRFLGACSATFGAADVGMGSIANVQPNLVQLLSGRTTVAVALGQIGKSLRAITRIVLSQSTVSGAHIRRDASVQ